MWELELIVLKVETIEDIGPVSSLFPDRSQPGSQLGPKYQMNQSRAMSNHHLQNGQRQG